MDRGRRSHPRLLARNALLVAVCAVAAAPSAPRPLGFLDAATIVLAVTTVGLLWLAGGRLASLAALVIATISGSAPAAEKTFQFGLSDQNYL